MKKKCLDFNGAFLWTLAELVVVDFNGVFLWTLAEVILWTLAEILWTLAALWTLAENCCGL